MRYRNDGRRSPFTPGIVTLLLAHLPGDSFSDGVGLVALGVLVAVTGFVF